MTATTVSNHETDLVLVEQLDTAIVRLTLNRPKQRNAMSQGLRSALIQALDDARPHAKVIIIRGAGPAFCAGVDLKERVDTFEHAPIDDQRERRTSWKGVQEEIMGHPAIIIASVNGFALGGGSTLINVSDLAVAAETAEIGMPEAGFGHYPGLAGPAAQFRIAHKRAAWMIFTAERISGRTAQEWGMVNSAVPGDQLDDATLDLARKVARFDAAMLAWSKKAMWTMPALVTNWSHAFDYGLYINDMLKARKGGVDGLRAFARGERNPGQGA